MTVDLRTILKPDATSKYQGQPLAVLGRAPVDALLGLAGEQVAKLNAHAITTLYDLASARDRLGALGIQIDPGVIQRLICLFFYPQHDPGPDCAWERLFQGAPLDYYRNYAGSPFHTHFGPVFYRGRLDGSARVLVIGQDPSTDEILGHRAFVGQAGQIAQNFLSRLGLTRSYVMFNTFLFGVQSGSITSAMDADATLIAYRNQLFDRVHATSPLTAILAFGAHANTSAINWPGRGALPILHVSHPTAQSGVAANWNSHFAAASAAIAADADGHVDATPYDTTAPLPTTDVPRRDLPFGVPSWHGTGGGTRSQRGAGAAVETQITWTAP